MELVKLGRKGQLSIPRAVLRELGISAETPMLVGTTEDGAIILRPAAVYPVETYSDDRVSEFLETDAMSSEQEQRLRKALAGAE